MKKIFEIEKALPYFILIFAIQIVYSNCYNNAFLYDDIHLIAENRFLGDWKNIATIFTSHLLAGNSIDGSYYRPLQMIAYLTLFQGFGLSTFAFHALNIALHTINACLMFRLGQKLNFQNLPAFAATLLWAIHPVHTEAVTYMSATADPLHTLFCLLGALVLLPDFSFRRILFACFFFIAALLSKEASIVFVLLAASLLYFKSPQRNALRTYLKLWPIAALAAVYLVLRSDVFGNAIHIAPETTATLSPLSGLAPVSNLINYLQLIVWPSPLYMKHTVTMVDGYWLLKAIIGLLVGSLGTVFILRGQNDAKKPLSWGMLWFVCAMIPALSMTSVIYEHWLYLPSIGLFLGLMQYASAYSKQLLLVAPLLGFLTFQQNAIWQNPVTCFSHIIKQNIPAAEAHTNLGIYYTNQKDYPLALQHYEMAQRDYEQSNNAFDNYNRSVLENNIATTTQLMGGNKDVVLEHFMKAMTLYPNNYKAIINLATFYRSIGDEANAKLYEEKAALVQGTIQN